MIWQDYALMGAGVVGGVTAIIHGVLTQRFIVAPLDALAAGDKRISAPIRRLVPAGGGERQEGEVESHDRRGPCW